MWRLFRYCVKNNTCPGNHAHFRLISTTCTTSETDDGVEQDNDPDVFGTLTADKENQLQNCNQNLAGKVTKQLFNSTINAQTKNPFSYEPNRLKAIDNSLKEIQWEKYLDHRKNIFSDIKNSHGKKSAILSKQDNISVKNTINNDEIGANNNDTFGSLSQKSKFEEAPEDKEDFEDPLKDTFGKRLSAQNYGKKMLRLCKERKLKEALNVLEIEMVSQHITPNTYCYNILINACGKAGYAEKAFSLFYQMKQRGMKAEKFAYTGLFNACANSPYKTVEGLNQARKLREQIKNKEIALSPITYHAMIKAFGHCGDIETAFEIVDEMVVMNHAITVETMSFLLQACITDKEAGFRHALMVWRKMREMRLSPNIHSYNLLLRCALECQAGDPKLTSQLLQTPPKHLSNKQEKNKQSEPKRNQIEQEVKNNIDKERVELEANDPHASGKSVVQISNTNKAITVNLEENMELEIIHRESPREEPLLPNILAKRFHPGQVIGIASLVLPYERLALLGGFSCVLENMFQDRVRPNAASFTFMLDSLPADVEAERALIHSMELCKVTPDVIFCNKLIRKRCLRMKLDEAQEVLDIMQQYQLTPDIITFGCLSVGCRKRSDVLGLLKDMEKAGFRPNENIMSTLIKNSICDNHHLLTIELLHLMKKHNVTPNERILSDLENCRKFIRNILIELESDKEKKSPVALKRKNRREEMKLFLIEYKNWLKKSPVELKDHPWNQFGYDEVKKDVAKLSVY